MEIKGFDHIGIRVMDVERAIGFYTKLGFAVTRRDPKERVVVLRHDGGIEINLLDSGTDDNRQKNILMDIDKRYPGYTHYAIRVESVGKAKLHLEAMGLSITEGPVTFGDDKTSVFVRDPDNNVIEFTQLARDSE